MNYAGIGSRFVAGLLDGLIVLAANFTVNMVTGSLGDAFAFLGAILNLVISIGYVVFYQQKTGQTLGKKVMKIKVVDAAGKTPSLMTFFLREVIGKLVSTLILYIGYLMALWDKNKQTLHDKIASTYVVKVDVLNAVPSSTSTQSPATPSSQEQQ